METTLTRQFEHLPPHDLDAERNVLGSLILADADIRAGVRSIVHRGDFYQADHQIIYDVICKILDDGRDLDGGTIRSELIRLGTWEEVGGAETIATILNVIPSGSHGRTYAEAVRERSKKRQIISLSNDLLRKAYGGDSDYTGDELLESASKRISTMMAGGRSAGYWKSADLMQSVFDQLSRGGVELIRTGVPSLDLAVAGIALGEMVLLAARPSMGKSTLLRQIVVEAAKLGTPTGIISLEENDLKIGRNMLSAECAIDNHKLRKGTLTDDDRSELVRGVGRISDLPIFGTDKARRIQDIRAVATNWVSQHGVKLIVLDYMQRVGGAGGKDEYERISKVSLELSNLWKELGVAAVVAAQLNRSLESRDDKRPIMSDLRGSGGMEQDADGIIFLHREDYYHLDESDYRPSGVAELIIAKWRDGVRGKVVKLQSDLKHQCFVEIDPFR